ncbi:NYN domain-containing protein [Croceimicrobium sp.]|uniref:NYN domain-containing protein n=1 Tax=Croceimicrobium sp. TaxID=2828340 RepID=UPI003BABD0A5
MKEDKIAVLIDADNVPYANIKEMLDEVTKYGNPTIKRIYADWTKPTVSGWKGVLLENAITPIQQYSYTSGKNSSDSALIIDAMDLLYSNKVNGFCIISSDSDFTRLATRLREAGMLVIGMGERKTPQPFITACDKFVYIEILKSGSNYIRHNKRIKETDQKGDSSASDLNDKSSIIKVIKASIDEISDDDGWAYLGELGNFILKKQTDFDPRNYGYQKLYPLLQSISSLEFEERHAADNKVKSVYVRNES